MNRQRTLLGLGAVLLASLAAPAAAPQPARQSVRTGESLEQFLPRRADVIYRALAGRFEPARAMEIVSFMDRFWRIPGNPGYAASLEHLKAGLAQAGFREGRAPGSLSNAFWFEEYPNGGNGWEPVRADMTIVDAAGGSAPEQVFDPVTDYIALCINSFSTPPGGVTAPLVYAGTGTDAAAYASLDVKGAVVLGDGGTRGLWQQAVRARGAIGVISAAPPADYAQPDVAPDIFQWGSVPYDESLKAFGFKASRKVADRLKARLKAGPVTVKVTVETRFHPSPGRTLVAEIPGTQKPDERVVMVAHVQEPGANDNASGCGTLLEAARALQAAIAARAVPPPARTLTFIWGDEITASREWLRADPARPGQTRYMFSLDMTGEDTTKTGGTFLIEKEPDPSAVWPRPSDPHTEWGGGSYRATALKGSLLNDLLLAVCQRRARDTGWTIRTNPYEGGSDHSVFLSAGVPALLVWHFPDRYYHTNLDRADKTSPAEMANVGVAVGTTAMFLAAATPDDAQAVVELLAAAAARRIELEQRQGAELVSRAGDRAAAEATERAVLDAWRAWYVRALESVLLLPVSGPGETLRVRVEEAARILRGPAQ